MDAQMSFKLDKKLRDQAVKKARSEGTSFSAILRMIVEDYVADNLRVTLEYDKPLNAKTRKELDEIMEDVKKGKNMSPAFHSAKEAAAWLKSNNRKWS
jgi:antitoxin component of RelBE/YafQ-DinJ toxin-antitoxin module